MERAPPGRSFGQLVDYQKMIERVTLKKGEPIEPPGTKRWFGTLPDPTKH